jgi:hypothetical protein
MASKEPRDEASREEQSTTQTAEYRPDRKIHLAEAGKVALSNWVGKVAGRRVRVYRGAQASKIPEPIQKAMAASGVGCGIITYEELGVRPPGQAGPIRRVTTPPAQEI